MCQMIRVEALQHETLELLEEESVDRIISVRFAMDVERAWEMDVEEYDYDLDELPEAA